MKTSKPKTKRGKKPQVPEEVIVEFLGNYGKIHGYAPSIREIMKATGLRSTSAVSYRLRGLKAKGILVWRMKGSARTWMLNPA